jgi:hypothetical protein
MYLIKVLKNSTSKVFDESQYLKLILKKEDSKNEIKA